MKKHLFRTMLLLVIMMAGSTDVWAEATLVAPSFWYSYYSQSTTYEVGFNPDVYVRDENGSGQSVYLDNIYYSINGSEYQQYDPNGKEGVMVQVGDTFSYYATAEGYQDSPVTTVTVAEPLWETKDIIADCYFFRDDDTALALHDDGPADGFRWLMDDSTGDILFDGRLATPNENIDSDFKIAANLGLVSAQDRTYAVSGLKKGQVLMIMVAKNENNGKEIVGSRRQQGPAKDGKSPRRVIVGGMNVMAEAVDGLELDAWNSQDEGWDFAEYAFHVTKDGPGIFTIEANRALQTIRVMGDMPPQQPGFSSPTVDGANRTYTIYMPGNATTLYYTTTLADTAPDKGDAAYSSTTASSVEVTVTGVGYLYAYAENDSGTSDIYEQYVNGVTLTLNAPQVTSKGYDSSTGRYYFYPYQNQNDLEGSPQSTIYYSINGGEAMTANDYARFEAEEGDVITLWCQAEGYTNSPVLTLVPQQLPQMTSVWNYSFTYNYSNTDITLGDEAETGLYQMQYGGNTIAGGLLLTPNESIGADGVVFRMGYYSGITANTPRTYAVQNLKVGQCLYVVCYNATVAGAENCVLDSWNSDNSYSYLRVTADGTVRFTVTPTQGYNADLRQISLRAEPEYGDIVVEDANGNRLNYHYESATSAATFTSVSGYASDEAKAGRIIIADKVTDKRGNEHEVKYISGSVGNRYDLVSVVFGQNIVSVGGPNGNSSQAFYNCQKLEKVVLNAKLDTIGAYSFRYCSALKDINFGDATSLRSVMYYAFQGCIFESLTINSPLSDVNYNSFYGCDSLKTVTFNSETVPSYFMQSRSYLQTINIGKSVKTVGENAFQYCYRVRALNIDPEVNDLVIGKYAFSDLDSLRTLSLPVGIKSMGEYCLANCDSLRTVEFAEESVITAIPDYCFSYDYNLQTVTLPNSVQTIGNQAFYYCVNLRKITFGTGLATNAFYNSGYLFYSCQKVEKMTIPGVNFPFQCSMYSLPNSMKLYVHPDMVATYKASDFTKKYHIIAIGSVEEFDIATTAGGQLAEKVPAEVAGNALRLKVSGPINGTDVNYLHELMPYLEELDLKDAQIVAGGEDYYRYSVSNNVATRQTSHHWQTEDNIVGQYMFYYMPTLKRLLLPAGVTEIRQYGLASSGTGTNYTRLEYVELPGSLVTIGDYAFYNDYSLAKADIPASVTSIGQNAFYRTGINKVTIPSGVTAIANSTFYNCEKLKSVTLHDDITTIGESAFSYCNALESINIPQNLQKIGSNAFYYCEKLASPLQFPTTLKSIDSYAFYYCHRVPSVTFSEGLETIGDDAFYYCQQLKEVILPESLTSLGSSAFSECDSLRTFTFPVNIKEVPSYVLSGCDALQSVTLATGTTRINGNAFYGCRKLTEMNYGQTTLTRIEQSAFYNTGFTAINVPENVTYIGGSAFAYCDSLKTATLPDGVTSMGTYVFDNDRALESANIPTSITTVPSYTFRNCAKLTSVTMHDGITAIGSYAFSGCTALTTIDLGSQIVTIDNNAFNNCQNLVLNALPSELKTIGSYAFANTYKLCDALTLPESLTTLRNYAFYHSGIKSIAITQPISSFSGYVFQQCDSLVSVALPKEMTHLPDGTFSNTSRLKTITLPDSLKEIGNYAFQESGLETIVLPAKLQKIDYEAFYQSKLKEVDLPLKLQTIGDYAFAYTQLRELRVPKNVTSVGGYVAAYCKNLKTAYLGRKQNYASNSNFDYFAGCDSLELLRVYAGTPPSISNYQYAVWTSSGWRSYASYRTNCVLEVPDGQVDIYQATDIWKEFKQIRAFESEEWLNQADFAALQKLYDQTGGANWTTTWNMESRRHANGKWQGVSTVVDEEDDELFYITAIDLTAFGLNGMLPKELFALERMTALNLSHNALEARVDTLLDEENTVLTTLNMEGNHLRGDLYPFVAKLPSLTDLNVSYNWLTAYSEATPNTTLTNNHMYRGFQFVDWQTKQVVVPEDLEDEVVTNYTPGTPVEMTPNSLQVYRHEYGDWGLDISYLSRIYASGNNLYTTSDGALQKQDGLWDADNYYVFKAPKGQLVAYTSGAPYWSYITHILRVDWQNGDVNGDQTVDVGDVQNVVYYALYDRRPGNQLYNYSAADLNSDNNINVQDIIGTVGLVLAFNETEQASNNRPYMGSPASPARNVVRTNGSQLLLTSADAVAALQLTIAGATTATIAVPQELRSLFSVSMKNVEGGVRLVLYSPQGNTLSPGEHLLLSQMPHGAEVIDVRLVDAEAQRLSIVIGGETTAIESIDSSMITDETPVFNLSGRRVGQWSTLPAGVYIVRVGGTQYKVRK